MDLNLNNKVAVITGASRGIGRAIAERLSAAGMKLVLAARSMDHLNEVAEKCGTEARAFPVDLRLENAPARLIEFAVEKFGRIDVLDTFNVFQATVNLTTGIRYEPSTGEFFLTDPEVVSVEVEGIPPAFNEPVTLAADLAVGTILDSYPVFTLEPEDFETNIARLVLKEVRIEDGSLVAKLSL